MEPRAVDQTCLESLELLARNNVVMNVDNHDAILSV
jgi:hypothetical protein